MSEKQNQNNEQNNNESQEKEVITINITEQMNKLKKLVASNTVKGLGGLGILVAGGAFAANTMFISGEVKSLGVETDKTELSSKESIKNMSLTQIGVKIDSVEKDLDAARKGGLTEKVKSLHKDHIALVEKMEEVALSTNTKNEEVSKLYDKIRDGEQDSHSKSKYYLKNNPKGTEAEQNFMQLVEEDKRFDMNRIEFVSIYKEKLKFGPAVANVFLLGEKATRTAPVTSNEETMNYSDAMQIQTSYYNYEAVKLDKMLDAITKVNFEGLPDLKGITLEMVNKELEDVERIEKKWEEYNDKSTNPLLGTDARAYSYRFSNAKKKLVDMKLVLEGKNPEAVHAQEDKEFSENIKKEAAAREEAAKNAKNQEENKQKEALIENIKKGNFMYDELPQDDQSEAREIDRIKNENIINNRPFDLKNFARELKLHDKLVKNTIYYNYGPGQTQNAINNTAFLLNFMERNSNIDSLKKLEANNSSHEDFAKAFIYYRDFANISRNKNGVGKLY